MPGTMEAFAPSRSLLNPKFEGYKLDPVSQEDSVASYPLQYKPTQTAISGKSSFSFQEVQSRITHNHISVCYGSYRAAYVDASSRIILVDLNKETAQPSMRVAFEFPMSAISPDALGSRNREYPSLTFLTSSLLFASDGFGLMYTLQISESGKCNTVGIFKLSENAMDCPFRIHSAYRVSPAATTILLSSRYYESTKTVHQRDRQFAYNVYAVNIQPFELQPSTGIQQLNVVWTRQGQDPPIYTTFEETSKSFLLIGGDYYHPVDEELSRITDPAPYQIASIPRAPGTTDEASISSNPPKPPPYSWTQTSDSVTVAIPLPSGTPKQAIHATFFSRSLTLHIDNDVTDATSMPRFSNRELWDGISPSTSYWTWDREGDYSFGLLTLYLDKQHPGTRWCHVFAAAGASAEAVTNFGDVEVPETLDPSELWHIRECLERYTVALREGNDASGLGLGEGMPSLAEGEIDEEVDESVGRSARVTWVEEDGTVPLWCAKSESCPFRLLSIPLPGSHSSEISLIVKHNLDGTVYSLKLEERYEKRTPCWEHTSTFSALAFVLASKRDTRFTYHLQNVVFAFEGGTQDRGGNVYLYRAASVKEKWAKQAILRVGGPLLGIAMMGADAKPLFICLTEAELVVIRNL